ncbi:hypothetical protein [uncultured Chryseobacterium sp.]|uniref:hypothetical protein n=1 Tax=uncultured Chryseobacterium sp. TaxID=259322 RepID=UPI0025FFE6F0|nr:hypothetical protein [uncultured Chryseobacterium sp.]
MLKPEKTTRKAFDYLDQAYEIIFAYSHDYEKANPKLTDLLNRAENEKFVKNSAYYQLMGTLAYFICKSKVKNTPYQNLLPGNPVVERNFKWSLDIDTYNPPLQYLYGLYLYDTGKFLKAESMFSEIDIRYFQDLELNDRAIKIKELIVCCKIFSDDSSEDEIIRFLKELDREQSICLSDLRETLKSNSKYHTEKVCSALKK